MKSRFLMLLFLTLIAHAANPQAAPINTIWQGTYVADSEPHRISIQISIEDLGAWKASNLSIEFIRDPLTVDSISLNGTAINFSVNQGKGSFAGNLSADGNSLTGTFKYGPAPSSPLTLHRVVKETAWHVPFRYQYHYKNIHYDRPSVDEPTIPFSERLAIEYMEKSLVAWEKDWNCVSCHTNGTYMVVRPLMTNQLGAPSNEQRQYFVDALHTQMSLDPDDPKSQAEPTQVVYIAAGLAIWDAHVTHHLSPETSDALALMFKLQRESGDWFIGDDNNPPLESNTFQLATVAARAIGNAPGWLALQRGSPTEIKINRLRDFLRAAKKPQGDYDFTDLLWADAEWPGLLDTHKKQDLIKMVLAHQKSDGGWSLRTFAKPDEWGKGNRAELIRSQPDANDPPSDGHMTGLAIIALRKAGVPTTDPQIQRGVQWLLANQRASGRWFTKSLNDIYGYQYITYSGTAYPLLALSLCNALPTTQAHK